MNIARLQFAFRFFLLSLFVLSFTYLSSNLINKTRPANTYLVRSRPSLQAPIQAQKREGALLSFLGPQAVQTGERVELILTLNTDSQSVQAVDVVIEYDPAMLEFQNLKPNNLFFEPLPIKNKTNRIYFSTVASDMKSFTGNGELAIIKFVAMKKGKASVNIIHTPNDTTDSNVVLKGKTFDSLDGVKNITINIL